MTNPAPHFAMLAGLANETSSEGRRELLRKATEMLAHNVPQGKDLAAFDQLLATVAKDYATQVRAELAQLIVSSEAMFTCSAQIFALDEIAVAEPVLKHSRVLSDETLLQVIAKKSQDHMMAVTGRAEISPRISHALVESGNDAVVTALLANNNASIAAETFEAVAHRADSSTALQAPLVRRKDVPLELLNDMYHRVEAGLRREIVEKFAHVPADQVEKVFRNGRGRVASQYGGAPPDMNAAKQRINTLSRQGQLNPPMLASLLREGPSARTAFTLAFATLADVEFDLVRRAVETQDIDTIALLCRGSNFERALFVALALSLAGSDKGLAAADEFGALYESVPVQSAQRALRFYKVRASA